MIRAWGGAVWFYRELQGKEFSGVLGCVCSGLEQVVDKVSCFLVLLVLGEC